jgi:hypothetical protein
VAQQGCARLGVKTLEALAFLGGAFRQKRLGQGQHILTAITQCRQRHRDDMQAVI